MPDGTEQAPKPGTTAASRPAVRPWLVALMTVPALLAGAALVAAIVVLPPMIRERVVAEARARGVILQVADVSLWFGSVTLEGAAFELQGVEGVHAAARRIDVLLDGMTPSRADVEGLSIDVARSAPGLLLDLERWSRRHASGGGAKVIPLSARDVDVAWTSEAGAEPWLVVRGAAVSQSAGRTSLQAPSATVAGQTVQGVGASWTATDASLALVLGSQSPDDATLTVSVDRTATPVRATIALAPTPVGRLVGALALPAPMDDASVHGKAELVLPDAPGAGLVRGHVEGTLDGFTPPHPIELDGFDFGDATSLSTDIVVSTTYDQIDLDDTQVRAGAFVLRGDGQILRQEDHVTAVLKLRGKLPCGTIARAAVRARAGSVLGQVLGDAVKDVIDGSVAVHVTVSADSRTPDQPTVTPRIGVGCGLRPLSLAELAELGIRSTANLAKGLGVPEELVNRARGSVEQGAATLEKGAEALEKRASETLAGLPSALPPLPSALPLPRLPKLPFEPRQDLREVAPGGAPAPEGSVSP